MENRSSPFRLSLRMLLILTAVAAFGCAALLEANEGWQLAAASVALLAMLMAAISTVVDRGAGQAAGLGFLIGAGLHLLAMQTIEGLPSRRLFQKIYEDSHQARAMVGRGGANSSAMAWSGQTTLTPSLPGNAHAAGPVIIGATPTPHPPGPGVLQDGDTGAPVRALQGALNEWTAANNGGSAGIIMQSPVQGRPRPMVYVATLQVDGDFGDQTRRAVENLQRSLGLNVDGVMSLAAWEGLGEPGRRHLALNGVPQFLKAGQAEEFVAIGEWLTTLVLGLAGGELARAMYARRAQSIRRVPASPSAASGRPEDRAPQDAV